MEELKVKGIVLKSSDYKDNDKLVKIFCAEFGVITARVRGVKKAGAKLAFAVQPFAFVEFLLTKNGNFYTCINATSVDQFFGLTDNFDNYIFMLGCLEICLKTVQENDSQPDLFIMLLNSLRLVCYENINSMYIFIKFMLESLKLLGFFVEISKCANCQEKIVANNTAFSFDFNGVLCPKCLNSNMGLELSIGEYSILKFIDESSFEDLKRLSFKSRDDLISVISLLIKDFKVFMDIDIESIQKFL